MSRHVIDLGDQRSLVVGWDPPLNTFFAILRDERAPAPKMWIGTGLRELYDLDALHRALPNAELRASVMPLEAQLYLDRDEGV